MDEKRLIGANALREVLDKYDPTEYGVEKCAAMHIMADIQQMIDSAPAVLAMVLPCDYGAKLYKVTKPYRQAKQVTEFIVVNFRTAGKKHVLQVEVRVNGMPGTNWMPYSKFHASKEEAEAALGRAKNNG